MNYARTLCTLCSLVVVGTLATVGLPGVGAVPAAGAGEDLCFVSAVNAARSSTGLAPLGVNGDLLRIARAWSAVMAANGDISHNPNISSLAPQNWLSLGENVGVGPSCDSVVQAFMNSSEHRKNILDPSYSWLGVGVVDGSDGRLYVTEDFMGTGGTPMQAAVGHAPVPVEAAPRPVAPPPSPTAEPGAPPRSAPPVPVSRPTTPPIPRTEPPPAPRPPAPPVPAAPAAPKPSTAPVPSARPVVELALPAADPPRGILSDLARVLAAFFAGNAGRAG